MPEGKLARVRVDYPPLVPGRLIRRYQRFLAEVELADGSTVTAHCPNSGSMLGCLQAGAPVRLSPRDRPGRRTAFTWEMIRLGRHWVGINTLVPNRLAARAAELRALPLFREAGRVRREVRVSDKSRVDLMVQTPGGELYVEVKNVTLVQGGRARFPDAVTSRGARHLRELMSLVRAGKRAAMLYLVQRGDARDFAPARDIDPTYAGLFERARRQGVEMVVVRARVGPRGVRLDRLLPLAPPAGSDPQ